MRILANLVQFVGLDAKMDLEIGSPSSVAKIDWNSSAQTSIPQQQVYEKLTFVIHYPTIPRQKKSFFSCDCKKAFNDGAERLNLSYYENALRVCARRERKYFWWKWKWKKNMLAFELIFLNENAPRVCKMLERESTFGVKSEIESESERLNLSY